jgi:hypothetical protein
MELLSRVVRLPSFVTNPSDGNLPGGFSSHYLLGARHDRFQVSVPALRELLATRAALQCGSTVKDTLYPLFRPTIVASIKYGHNGKAPFKARVAFDLDSVAGEEEYPTPQLLLGLVVEFLRENSEGCVDWDLERAMVFMGSFNDTTKRVSAHVYFCDLCWENDGSCQLTKTDPLAIAFNAKLKRYGVEWDCGISNSGLKYAFMDKWDHKTSTWRGMVQVPALCVNFPEGVPLTFNEVYQSADPLVIETDLAWEFPIKLKRVEREAPPPRVSVSRKRQREHDSGEGTVMQRIEAKVPDWAGLVRVLKHGYMDGRFDLLVPNSKFCPLLNGEHSSSRKSYCLADSNGVVTIKCWSGKCEGEHIRLLPAHRQLEEKQARDALNELNERYVLAPIGTRGAKTTVVWTIPKTYEDEFRSETISNLRASNTNQFTYFEEELPSGKFKRVKVLWVDMWLAYKFRRECPRGTTTDPEGVRDGTLNLWRGWDSKMLLKAEPLMEADRDVLLGMCSGFMQHIEINICRGDKDLMVYLLCWCSWLFQRPGDKPGVALALTGAPGQGKTAFFEYLCAIVGRHHSRVFHDSEQMSSRFNAAQSDQRLLVFDEAMATNSKQAKGIINGLITSSEMESEAKFDHRRVEKSFCCVLLCSNEVNSFDAQSKERRFQCFDCAYSMRWGKLEFFKALAAERDSRTGPAAFYALCMQQDISEWNPQTLVKGAALWRNKYFGLAPVDKWWFHCLLDGFLLHKGVSTKGQPMDGRVEELPEDLVQPWGEQVPFGKFRESALAFHKDLGNSAVVGRAIRKGFGNDYVGYWEKHRLREDQGGRTAFLQVPPLKLCRTKWQEWIGEGPEIWGVWGLEIN